MNTEHLKATLARLRAEPERFHQGTIGGKARERACVAGFAAEAAGVTLAEDDHGTMVCTQTSLDTPGGVSIGMSVMEVAQAALELSEREADAMFTPLPNCAETGLQFLPDAGHAQTMLEHAVAFDRVRWTRTAPTLGAAA